MALSPMRGSRMKFQAHLDLSVYVSAHGRQPDRRVIGCWIVLAPEGHEVEFNGTLHQLMAMIHRTAAFYDTVRSYVLLP